MIVVVLTHPIWVGRDKNRNLKELRKFCLEIHSIWCVWDYQVCTWCFDKNLENMSESVFGVELSSLISRHTNIHIICCQPIKQLTDEGIERIFLFNDVFNLKGTQLYAISIHII